MSNAKFTAVKSACMVVQKKDGSVECVAVLPIDEARKEFKKMTSGKSEFITDDVTHYAMKGSTNKSGRVRKEKEVILEVKPLPPKDILKDKNPAKVLKLAKHYNVDLHLSLEAMKAAVYKAHEKATGETFGNKAPEPSEVSEGAEDPFKGKKKDDLIEWAESLELDSSGTMAELKERISEKVAASE